MPHRSANTMGLHPSFYSVMGWLTRRVVAFDAHDDGGCVSHKAHPSSPQSSPFCVERSSSVI
ncbi:MAG: hypothetical protein FWD63_09015, partial [Propionibacteriaceae bacterium]|nr:hypothetical protein [Propionibacteriaceae bacterium]